MPNKPTPHSAQEIWQSQTEEETNMTLKDIRSKALKFQAKIRRRNIREYLGIVVGTVLYGFFISRSPNLLVTIGAVLTLVGMYFSVYQIYRDGSSQQVPVDESAGHCLEFHRREITRQRDMLRRVGPLQIGPIMPGMALFFAGHWVDVVHDLKAAIIMTITFALAVAVFGFVYWLNVHAANKLQSQLDDLGE